MTGMLIPEFWTESEMSSSGRRQSFLQWLLGAKASAGGRAHDFSYVATPTHDKDDAARQKYLADIW